MTILGYDFEGYFTWFNIKLRCKIWLTQHHVPCDFNEQERDAIYRHARVSLTCEESWEKYSSKGAEDPHRGYLSCFH